MNSSPSYDVKGPDGGMDRWFPAGANGTLCDCLLDIFEGLRLDPLGHSKEATLPYPPIGRVAENFTEGREYFMSVFFEIDDERKSAQ